MLSKALRGSIVLLLAASLLMACTPQEPTRAAPRTVAPTLGAGTSPIAEESPTLNVPGANRGPAAPNQSTVEARVLSIDADPASASNVRVQALIVKSTPVDGNLDFLQGVIGQQVILIAPRAEMVSIAKGMTIRAQAIYIGDERGGSYHISQIQEIAP